MARMSIRLFAVCFLLFGSLWFIARGEEEGAKDAPRPEEKANPTDAALLAYLRQHCQNDADFRNCEQLIQKLGDTEFDRREEASAKLVNLGLRALPALRKACKDNDTEIARRAKACIAAIDKESRQQVALTTVRRLLERQPAGLVAALVDYLPYAEDEAVEEAIYFGLDRVAERTKRLDPVLIMALTDDRPARRALAAGLVGSRGNAEQRQKVRSLLTDTDATVRLRAAQGLLASKDKAGISALIALLEDPSPTLAWQAEELLRWVAGDKAPAPALGAVTPAARRRYRESWETWRQAHAAAVDLNKEDPDQRRPSLLLVWNCPSGPGDDQPSASVWLYGGAGVPLWQWNGLKSPKGVQLLSNGHVMAYEQLKTGQRHVLERDLESKVVWKCPQPSDLFYGFQRLPSGNILFVSNDRLTHIWSLSEITPEGEEVLRRNCEDFPYTPVSSTLFGGRILCNRPSREQRKEEFWEFDATTGTKVRRDLAGKDLDPDRIFHIEPLPTGGFLLAHQDGVTEVDATGRAVWKSTNAYYARFDFPTEFATRLHNGNTLLLHESRKFFIEEEYNGKPVAELFTKGYLARECLSLVRLGFDGPRPADWRVDSVASRQRQLRHKDPQVRARAVECLLQLGPQAEPAIPDLIEAFDDPEPMVSRLLLAIGIGEVGPKILPYIYKALKDPRAKVRTGAVVSLRDFPDVQKHVPPLIDALHDESWQVRSAAAWGLAQYGPKTQLMLQTWTKHFIEVRRDSQLLVTGSVISAFAKIEPQAAQPVPAAFLKVVLPPLIRALKDDNRKVASSAASALAAFGSQAQEAVPALIEAIKVPPTDANDNFRFKVLRSLMEIGPSAKDAVPFLIEAFNSKQYAACRGAIADTLGEIGPEAKSAIPVLIEGLKGEGNKRVRYDVVSALGKIGSDTKETIPVLVLALKNDASDDVREEAATILGRLKGANAKAAVPALIEALKVEKRIRMDWAQKKERVRIAAATALGEIGPDAKAALPALREAARERRWHEGADYCAASPEEVTKPETKMWVVVDPKFQPAIQKAIEKIEGRR